MHGITHNDGTCITLHIFYLNYAYFGVNRAERYPFGVFYIIVFIAYPRFASLTVFTDNEAIETQLRKRTRAGRDTCGEHIANCFAHYLNDALFKERSVVRFLFTRSGISHVGIFVSMRSTDQQLRDAVFFFADISHAVAIKISQVDRHLCYTHIAYLHHQSTCIHRVV